MARDLALEGLSTSMFTEVARGDATDSGKGTFGYPGVKLPVFMPGISGIGLLTC
jgi:hypothetical protein